MRDKFPNKLLFCGIDLHNRSHIGGPVFEMEIEKIEENIIIESLRNKSYLIKGKFFSLKSRNAAFSKTVLYNFLHISYVLVKFIIRKFRLLLGILSPRAGK